MIFCHGIQFWDLHQVSRYVKNNPECKLIADNHAANINSARNILSRQILHKVIYKIAIQRALPFISMVYVLAPGCRDFADVYKRQIPNMAEPFSKKLYSTYLTYLPEEDVYKRQAFIPIC